MTSNTFDLSQVKTSRNLQDVTKVGFPRVEDYITSSSSSNSQYRRWVKENIIDMGDPEVPDSVKNNIESIVDLEDSDNHMLINTIKPKVERSKQQQKLREKIIKQAKAEGTYGSMIDKNVLILYIDNISRAHFYREMPRTVEFLSKLYQNPDTDASAYQFFRYHSSFFNTLRSNNGLWYGQVDEVTDTSTNVFDSFADNGYMTGFFKDA